VPLAKWIVPKTPGWQVWSVERGENLLEDQSELNLFKEGKATATPALRVLPRLGLVYIDGASSRTPETLSAGGAPAPMTAALATQELQALDQPSVSPWLSFGGITAP
jgi:hypothetical protein